MNFVELYIALLSLFSMQHINPINSSGARVTKKINRKAQKMCESMHVREAREKEK